MARKKVLIAADHAGLPLKNHLLETLKSWTGPVGSPFEEGAEFIDLGTHEDKSVDYPDYTKKLCEALLNEDAEMGILVCGSGQGMAMGANRYKKIRAALCWNLPSAQLSREHNNANVLCLGSRLIPFGYATEITKTWLATSFLGGRHQGRVNKLGQL